MCLAVNLLTCLELRVTIPIPHITQLPRNIFYAERFAIGEAEDPSNDSD